MSSDLALILGLAKAALEAERSPAWNTYNVEMAAEIHGAACDRLWDELKRQLALADSQQIPQPPSPKNQMQLIRKEAFKRLKERLPELIEEAIGEIDG